MKQRFYVHDFNSVADRHTDIFCRTAGYAAAEILVNLLNELHEENEKLKKILIDALTPNE